MTDDNVTGPRVAGWSNAFRVDVDAIDAAHRHLFALVAELCNKREGRLVERDLDELERYAREHFRDEEALMAASGYPARQRHQASHARFLAQVTDARARLAQASADDNEILEFLSAWLVDHIQGEDQRAADFFLERRPPAGWLTRMLGRHA